MVKFTTSQQAYKIKKNHTWLLVLFQTQLQRQLGMAFLLHCFWTLCTCCPETYLYKIFYFLKAFLRQQPPTCFEMAKNWFDKFQQKYPIKGLASCWSWWEKRKCHVLVFWNPEAKPCLSWITLLTLLALLVKRALCNLAQLTLLVNQDVRDKCHSTLVLLKEQKQTPR